jgi:ABC-type sugar transport system ATPase subunit
VDDGTLLSARGITKTFSGVYALRGVDFQLKAGEIHALLGENGAGKSTLMNILAGIFPMDSGEIRVKGEKAAFRDHRSSQRAGISIVFQERSLLPNLTVTENVFGGLPPTGRVLHAIDWNEAREKTRGYLEAIKLRVSPDAIVGMLPAAAQQMVEVAKAMANDFDILILDEPTSTITVEETQVIFDVLRGLRNAGKGIVYISHRLREIKEIADRATVLKDGEYIGTYGVGDVSLEFLVSKMVGRKVEDERIADAPGSEELVLETRKLSGRGFRDVDLSLRKGEILTITGLSGAGRTELARALFGETPARSGKILVEGRETRIRSSGEAMRLGIGYVSEDRKELGLFLDMMIKENIEAPNLARFSKGPILDQRMVAETAEEYCRKIGIRMTSIDQKVVYLSGGNQQKVCLAKWILFNPKILIIDEPTKGVDVGAKYAIYAILRDLARSGIGIIVISSDMMETLSLGSRVMVMCEGRVAGESDRSAATEEGILALASNL